MITSAKALCIGCTTAVLLDWVLLHLAVRRLYGI